MYDVHKDHSDVRDVTNAHLYYMLILIGLRRHLDAPVSIYNA